MAGYLAVWAVVANECSDGGGGVTSILATTPDQATMPDADAIVNLLSNGKYNVYAVEKVEFLGLVNDYGPMYFYDCVSKQGLAR